MPDSNLSLTYDELRQRIGKERGHGTDIERWSDSEKENIEFIIKDALRTFYSGSGYEWSFLKPLAELTIANGTTSLVLPADFGFLIGNIYFDEPAFSTPLMVVGDVQDILRMRQQSETSGRPSIAAFSVMGAPGQTHNQRQTLEFWPEASDSYDLVCRYSVLPDALSSTSQYCYGGQMHAETIKEACLAASEKFDGVQGLHSQLYMQCLNASITNDRKLKPQSLGMNGRLALGYGNQTVTYVPNL